VCGVPAFELATGVSGKQHLFQLTLHTTGCVHMKEDVKIYFKQ